MHTPHLETTAGRVTLATILSLVAASSLAFLFNIDRGGSMSEVHAADSATTTVTVLNTPPDWSVRARERFASATNTPTNVGTSTVWEAQATDANAEDYYLIICTSDVTPTITAGNPPECDGGSANEWAISPLASSGDFAVAERTALGAGNGTPVEAEENDWFAFICDSNSGTPSCNSDYSTGTSSGTDVASPFVVNNPVNFGAITNTGGALPGNEVTWDATASDTVDVLRTASFQLFVCATDVFDGNCESGQGLGTSTAVSLDPSATTSIPNPAPDGTRDAYVFIADQFGLEATGPITGASNSSFYDILNATPTIDADQVDLGSSTDITLTVEAGETPGIELNFDVADDNSCAIDTNGDGTSEGDEIASYVVNVHRSGIASSSCDEAGEYDPASCYPQDVGPSVWNLSCSQRAGSCTGVGDSEVTIECTFPLWFLAQPTDNAVEPSFYESEHWVATVEAIDDDGATSTATTSTAIRELNQFLQFDVVQNDIAYGGIAPGNNSGTLSATSVLQATGNTGLDQDVQGSDMCVSYPDCSSGIPTATSTIFVYNQEWDITSGVTYGAGNTLFSTSSPGDIEINISSTTATSTFAEGTTYWGIQVPSSVTFAGDYRGVNTITGIVGESSSW
ncbi:hypothetical protein GVX82_00095 [Patescibacteria group bacterium]|jgi:hypothetical protein|nr:hypothetical protein [Patescibacteria group bacterium]